jgi:PhoH-like ATPase
VAKTYVIDTNVLLYDPYALTKFDEHTLVLPMTVIEEIDTFKKDMSEKGYAAREISRVLDDLRTKGSLRDGVALPNGGTLKVDYREDYVDTAKADNRILEVAARLRSESPDVVLVSRDTNMRLKGDAMGVHAEDYQNAKVGVDSDDLYVGHKVIETDPEVIDAVHEGGSVGPDKEWGTLQENQFVHLKCGRQSALTQYSGGFLYRLPDNGPVWSIRPRNKEQTFALHLLMDPDISLVTISGIAGTGKTLLALAAGLCQQSDAGIYSKVLVSRPIFPMGRDLGYLPGTMEEKMNPWMKPIFDNLELIVGGTKSSRDSRHGPNYQYLLDSGVVEVEALTYIRGRSIPKQYLIVDEAQNLTPHEVKTILTRAGEGTKVVLTGDPAQIDNPYVDSLSNGLTYVIERFKGQPEAGHITLQKGERSRLAALAAQLL